MTTERIKEIQDQTAYPDSISVQQALMKVWNECEQEQLRLHNVSKCCDEYLEVRDLYKEPKTYRLFCNLCNTTHNQEKIDWNTARDINDITKPV